MSTRDESCEMQSAYFPARREGQVMICDLFAFLIKQSGLIMK